MSCDGGMDARFDGDSDAHFDAGRSEEEGEEEERQAEEMGPDVQGSCNDAPVDDCGGQEDFVTSNGSCRESPIAPGSYECSECHSDKECPEGYFCRGYATCRRM